MENIEKLTSETRPGAPRALPVALDWDALFRPVLGMAGIAAFAVAAANLMPLVLGS